VADAQIIRIGDKKMSWIDETRKMLADQLIGKRFAYISKHGGTTFGTVTEVGATHRLRMDQHTEKVVGHKLSKISPKMQEIEHPGDAPEGLTKWSGRTAKFWVLSENRVSYDLDEIYIVE
jgi:hypothetical protein